jgi:hypothetical protein
MNRSVRISAASAKNFFGKFKENAENAAICQVFHLEMGD